MTTVDCYNNIVDVMNVLEATYNYRVNAFANKYEGYGFYIDLPNNYYIQCHVWVPEYNLQLKHKEIPSRHDIIDKKITSVDTESPNEVLEIVLKLIATADTFGPNYKIEGLTEEELNYLKSLPEAIAARIVNKVKKY